MSTTEDEDTDFEATLKVIEALNKRLEKITDEKMKLEVKNLEEIHDEIGRALEKLN